MVRTFSNLMETTFRALAKYLSLLAQKKISLVSGNQPGEIFFYHSSAHIVESVSEYIFLISEKKSNNNKKTKSNRN